eukprot:1372575-Lingulodinium_polyedra.AAC.1
MSRVLVEQAQGRWTRQRSTAQPSPTRALPMASTTCGGSPARVHPSAVQARVAGNGPGRGRP